MFVLGMAGFFNDFVDAGGVGGHDGHRRPLRRDGLRRHEHDGQHRRRLVGHRRRLPAGVDVSDWTLTFYISAAIYLIGAVCWLFLDSHTPVVPAETV